MLSDNICIYLMHFNFHTVVTSIIRFHLHLDLVSSLLSKVIIEKSRGEVSLMGQDTIENVS